jgi:hypothetical protein
LFSDEKQTGLDWRAAAEARGRAAFEAATAVHTCVHVPFAPARLLADHRGFRWEVPSCPICGKRHLHGGGSRQDDPRKVLSHRVAHCFRPPENNGYTLVDVDPVYTARILAEVGLR